MNKKMKETLPLNQIICGDCLKVIKKIPDKSIDFCFSDIPYNVGKDYGIYKDDLSEEKYKQWMSQIIFEMKKKSQGICLLVGAKLLKLIWDIIPESKMIVIHRRAMGSYNKNYFYMYFALLTTKKPIKRTLDLWNDVRMSSEGYFCKEKKYHHPAPTSESVTTKIIKTFTKENDIVLDCFSGSGTTAVICKRYNRKFIGIEINPKYCKIARKRIKDTIIKKKKYW